MLFFAWGTNMDREHLRGWLPSARKLTIASLPGHEFRFHKRSSEGAKADAFGTGHPGDVVWGVIFEISDEEAQALDRDQRRAGYRPKPISVFDPDGTAHAVVTYVAENNMIDPSQLPFASYKDPIVRAARENGLPEKYVIGLERLPVAAE